MVMEKDFDLVNALTEGEQNVFFTEYLTTVTRFLKQVEFPHSKGYHYFSAEFMGEAYHGTTITNIYTLLVVLVQRNHILPIRFVNDEAVHPVTGTPIVYFIFPTWPIGDLSDEDFDSVVMVQDDEFIQYAHTLST
jgi:hypothetical protein